MLRNLLYEQAINNSNNFSLRFNKCIVLHKKYISNRHSNLVLEWRFLILPQSHELLQKKINTKKSPKRYSINLNIQSIKT